MSGITLAITETRIPRLVQAIQQLYQGRVNSGGTVTLRASQTTTTVSAPNCSPSCSIHFAPVTAHAAALSPPPYVMAANTLLGSFVITHPSNAAVDLTFKYDARG
jgi:hypothetical protein